MDEKTNIWKGGMDIPKISIITVCFNSAKTIRDTIESVINQTYQNIEYIIIDGGSTDGTIDIIKEYEPYIAKWVSETDNGIYDAMNKGIKMATGEIIGLVNSDDQLESDALALVISEYLKNKSADIIYGNMQFIVDKSFNYIITSVKNVREDFIYGKMPVCHPATFVTRKVYQSVGVFRTEYRNAGDYEFILRCIKNNTTFLYVNEVLTNMYSGGVSTDYKTTFKETREINILYGCNPIIAWLRYYESCIKTKIYNTFKNNIVFKMLYKWHKKDNIL